jgi:hypothetical protein
VDSTISRKAEVLKDSKGKEEEEETLVIAKRHGTIIKGCP